MLSHFLNLFVRRAKPKPGEDIHEGLFFSFESQAKKPVSALKPVDGLARLKHAPKNPKLLVRAGEREQVLAHALQISKIDKLLAYYECHFHFVLNTHMLDNGALQLACILLDESGSEVTSGNLDLNIDNSGTLADNVKRLMREYASPWVLDDGVDSTHFPFAKASQVAWVERADAVSTVPAIAKKYVLKDAEAKSLGDFVKQGYAVLPDTVPESLVDELNRDIDTLVKNKTVKYDEAGDPRIEQVHVHSRAARDIWALPQVSRFLEAVFDSPPLACQTLVFIRGSQQAVHQDTIHLTPFPQGYMCGVWVALEDVKAEAGPLVYYPGSQSIDRLYTRTVGMEKVRDGNWKEYSSKVTTVLLDEIEKRKLSKETFLARKGQILVWHENLAHGGSVQINKSLTRRSVVSHYFAKGSIAFYDSSGNAGAMHKLSDAA